MKRFLKKTLNQHTKLTFDPVKNEIKVKLKQKSVQCLIINVKLSKAGKKVNKINLKK